MLNLYWFMTLATSIWRPTPRLGGAVVLEQQMDKIPPPTLACPSISPPPTALQTVLAERRLIDITAVSTIKCMPHRAL